MTDKKTLKKINHSENAMVRTLGCHCGCEGKAWSAFGNGYMGRYL